MAQKVQLTGYQGPSGFRTEQVYDASRQIQQQGEQITQQMERVGQQMERRQTADLQTLATFSSTLGTFLKDYQTKENEKQYNLGLADVINGETQLPESMYDLHDKKTEVVRMQAEADGQVANQIEASGNLPLAETFRTQSRAISGWRAYGQAVGVAKKSAVESQGFLTEFMERTEKIIPTPSGMKSPLQIKTEGTSSEVNAALAIGQQEFIKARGLAAINPIVLADHFAPTFQAAKEQTKTNAIVSAAANRRETAEIETLNRIKISATASNASVEDLSKAFQQETANLETFAGLSKGKASNLALQGMLTSILTLPPDEARARLTMLEGVAKLPGDAKSLLGKLHGDMFRDARNQLDDKELQAKARKEAEDNDKIEKIKADLDFARANEKDPVKLRQIESGYLSALGEYANTNVKARTILTEEKLRQITPEQTTRFNRALGQKLTLDQIEGLDLPEDQKEILKKQATDRNRTGFTNKYDRAVTNSAQNVLQDASKEAISFDVNGKPSDDPEVFAAYSQAVEDKLFSWYQSKQQQGIVPSEDEIQKELQNISKTTFYQYYQSGGKAKTFPALTTSKNAKGDTVYNATTTLPRDLDSRYSHPSTTKLLTKEETLANLERYRDGGTPTQRVKSLYRSGDRAFLITQAEHYGIDPTPYVGAQRGQQESDNRSAAPNAASRYYSSENALAQSRAALELAQGRARKARLDQKRNEQYQITLPSGNRKPLADVDILKLSLNQGLSDRDAVIMTAISLAESAGIPDNTNFNRQSGDQSYGLWQINMIDELGPARAKDLKIKNYEELLDAETNSRAMRYVLQRQGFGAWSVFRNGSYRQYLPDAERALIQLRKSNR